MTRRKPRGLSPEEEELWRQVARTTRPISSSPFKPAKSEPKEPAPPRAAKPIQPFEIGAKTDAAHSQYRHAPTVGEEIADRPLQMDKKTFGKMKRGKTTPESRLDLHGMTAAAAHSALIRFILSAQAEGKRLVLVITGKGRDSESTGPIPTRTGILRHQLPHWLDTPPLSQAVLQVVQAHRRHGGSGAFYVYLARRR